VVFVESGVKVNAAYYREAILEGCLKAAAKVFADGANRLFNKTLHRPTKQK
jgi:hypothetical protein